MGWFYEVLMSNFNAFPSEKETFVDIFFVFLKSQTFRLLVCNYIGLDIINIYPLGSFSNI